MIKIIKYALLFLSLAFTAHGATIGTGSTYELNAASGGAASSASADINDVAIDISSVANMGSFVASVNSAAGSVNIVDAQPAAQDVDVVLDLSQTLAIDSWFFGFNINVQSDLKQASSPSGVNDFLHLGEDQDEWEDLMILFPTGLWRFPGSEKTVYWYETGDASYDCGNEAACATQIPNSSWTLYDRMTEYDLQAVYDTAVAAGSVLYPRIGHPELTSLQTRSTDAVKWINDEALSITYFDIGNEPFYTGQNWASDGSGYADEYDSWRDDFVGQLATAKFGAPHAIRAKSVYWNTNEVKDFFDRMHSTYSSDFEDVDIIAGHLYQRNQVADDYADLFSWSSDKTQSQYRLHYQYLTERLVSIRSAYSELSGAKIIIGEFSPCTRSINEGNDGTIYKSVATAVWAADVLGRGARAGASAMLYDNMAITPTNVNYWASGLFVNDLSTEYPVLYTYLMFGQWWPQAADSGLWVTSVSSTDEGNLSVNGAVGATGKLYVMLMNATTGTSQDARITLSNVYGSATEYMVATIPAHSVYTIIIPAHIAAAFPVQGAAAAAIDADLTWVNPTGTTTVNIYFDSAGGDQDCTGDTGTTQVSTGSLVATYDPGTMGTSQKYCWRVDVLNADGTITGADYEFTTSDGPPPDSSIYQSYIPDSLGINLVPDSLGADMVPGN